MALCTMAMSVCQMDGDEEKVEVSGEEPAAPSVVGNGFGDGRVKLEL